MATVLIGLAGLVAGTLLRDVGAGVRTRAKPVPQPAVAFADPLLLRTLCHELRSPITALVSLTRALTDAPGQLSVTDREAIVLLAREQVLHLDGVWRQAVALARGTTPNPDDFRLPLHRILPAVLATVPADRIRVRVSAAAGEWSVAGQPIRQTLINLIDNALRHGPPNGRVQLRASVRAGRLVVVVADEGRSCAALHAALRRSAPPSGMSGLGLWVVRRLVGAQGGSVTAYRLRASGVAVRVVLPGDRPSPRARTWPRRAVGWPTWARRMGKSPVPAIRDRGGHRVQPHQGSTVRGQARRP
ncbi:sensor histidine kinase [Plantactinospora solaniradicis]|uniref:histidine kinase n=1 Tax=Plantactinospora solaniradicis TaxID=1723736 RepID=A0ABW1KM06_9ACTN